MADVDPLLSDRFADPRAVISACLERLQHSVTEGRLVTVVDSWVDGDAALCIVYRAPFARGLVGIRRETHLPTRGFPSDATELGQDIADFDIGEPLGSVSERLRVDVYGVQWWGHLLPDLPRRPS